MTAALGWDAAAFRQAHLSDEERQALGIAGYGGRSGLGARPVLLVVDLTVGFCGQPGDSLVEAVARYPHASGPAAWRAVPEVRALVESARKSEVPVVFTRPTPPSMSSAPTNRWDDKNDRQQDLPNDAYDIVADSGFGPDDLLLNKEEPSAFGGSPLARWLIGLGCDSVIVAGCTTSGCVRATVVDAFSLNLRVTVAGDACFDRVRVSHEAGLFDMDLKYADVLGTSDIIAALHDHAGRSTAAG